MNATNRIPVSVRITQEDADFIAELKIEGANTLSEKIRELLKQARLAHTQTRDYGSALTAQEQFFQAAKHDVLHAEKQAGAHSHIVARLFEQLPDLGATLAADLPEEADLDDLKKYERELMWRIVQVMAGLTCEYDMIYIARLDGRHAADIRPMVRLNVTVIAKQGDRREQGSAGGGGRYDLAYFDETLVRQFVDAAVKQALINLESRPAPAGEMTVVLGNGWPGVLLHEAVGHGLEGDFNRKETSVFSGRIGESVAAKGVTVVDQGDIADRRGSLNIDDEGNETRRTVLIEDGILVGYMQDETNSRLMGTQSTGNGRRESYASAPMPRMTNTFMENGGYEPDEIIASIDKGIYAVNFGGGQVDITSGKFVFSASEAWWVEGGKLQYPVKGATIIGNGPEVLKHVSMIGNDTALDSGVGVCGKDGQSVPVGVGQPTLRIDSGLTVGGSEI